MNVWRMLRPIFHLNKRTKYIVVSVKGRLIFYLSPELLLAYDISYFVGERRIGLVVVDEAHTVTTWGKKSSGWIIGF